MSVNFVQRMPGGLCYAHGRYTEGFNCPQYPACITDPQKPEYLKMGAAPAERARLESEVVKAAKVWHEDHRCISANKFTPKDKEIQRYDADGKLKAVVDALLVFENQR